MWLLYALCTMVLWGTAGVFAKLALRGVNWQQCMVATLFGAGLVCGFIWLKWHPTLALNSGYWWSAVLAEVAGMGGLLFLYLALNVGKLAVIGPITHLSVVITVLLAYLLFKEQLTLINWVGVGLALIALVLLTK